MDILGYMASFAMGIILGLMGGGGSILTVPILVYLFSLSPLVATGYSLFVVGLTALIGSFMYIKKGDIDFKTGLMFAIPSIIGVNIARGWIIPSIPNIVITTPGFTFTKEILIMATFALLMIVASYSMIKKRGEQKQSEIHKFARTAILALEGLIVGLIAGFVGAGGGFIIIPALVLFTGLAMRVAIGTSLMIIAAQSLLGFGGDLLRGLTVEWTLLTFITSVSIVGIIIGSTIARRVKEQKLKIAFGWFVLLMGATILVEQLSHLSF